MTQDYAYDRKDAKGKPLRRRAGADRLSRRRAGRPDEAPRLFRACTSSRARSSRPRASDIGVVTHGQGLWWLQVTLTGKEAHTGSTPMPMRVNAGLGMARIVEPGQRQSPWRPAAARRRRRRPHGRLSQLAATSSRARWSSPSTSAARTRRCSTAMEEALRIEGKAIADESRGSASSRDRAGRPFRSGDIRRDLRQGACATPPTGSATATRDIVSGAGHDACWINRVAPTAMVMCPCVDGLSPQRGRGRSPRNGRRPAPTCCSTRWSRRRRSWRERSRPPPSCPGLLPGIHANTVDEEKDVDGRDQARP